MGWEPTEAVTDSLGKAIFQAGSKLMLLDKTKSGTKGSMLMDWDPVSACFNRIDRPYGYNDSETDRYDADADITRALGVRDEFDEAIEGYN
jgi:hypothetical protein